MQQTKLEKVINSPYIFGWILIVSLGLLLIPFTAMMVTNSVHWKLNDFLMMLLMLFSGSSLLVLFLRKVNHKLWKWLLVTSILIFLYIWTELAVGVFFY
ncbi:MAG: hypothetical protein HWE27_09235 [Gammaproteobacteria bacterium]|nr:hypothetical protein [Gammaproteobacteria bacterium]